MLHRRMSGWTIRWRTYTLEGCTDVRTHAFNPHVTSSIQKQGGPEEGEPPAARSYFFGGTGTQWMMFSLY